MTPTAIRAMNRDIMHLMALIENKVGMLFHEYDADFDSRIFDAIDSKNPAKLQAIIKELEADLELDDEIENEC